MGVVYLAEDTVLGRRVAIKTLTDPVGPGNQHFRVRFLREARAVSSLSHPHIARSLWRPFEGGANQLDCLNPW